MSALFDPRTDILARRDEWGECTLAMLQQAYPHKLDHLILHEQDHLLPREIHPVFSGCYDWHSSVHMHWSLLRLCTLAPEGPWRDAAVAHMDAHFTEPLVAQERRYAGEPGRASFERPYGWAWLLKLAAELEALARAPDADPALARWRDALHPFAADIAARFVHFIGASAYPVRVGMHANSAFAMLLARDHALVLGDGRLCDAIDAAARRWFLADRRYPADYEPSGADFLSPGLCEALLMQRVLGADFAAWWQGFVPSGPALARWLAPAEVSDRRDPQLVHLDGLNLSRAWCLRALARSGALPEATAHEFARAALAHWQATLEHITRGDFAATHWLVSFALLGLDGA